MRKTASNSTSAEWIRLGRALRMLRQDQGMSQIALASTVGVTQVNISALERGATDHNYLKVADYLEGRTGRDEQPFASSDVIGRLRPLVEAVDAAEAAYRVALTRRSYDEEVESAGSDWQAAQHKLEGACVAYVRSRLGLPTPAAPRVEPEPLHKRSGGIRAALVGSCPLPQRGDAT